MSDEADHCAFVARAKEALPERVKDATELAAGYVSRENIDFFGRLSEALNDAQYVFAEHPDGEIPLGAVHVAFEAFEEIAALALAQLAMLRALHPTAGISSDDHGVEE